MRLRRTAFPTSRPIANATLTPARGFLAGRNTTRMGPRQTVQPSRRSALKSSRCRSRPIKPITDVDPSGVGFGLSPDRPEFAYVDGSRVYETFGGCWVEKFSSSVYSCRPLSNHGTARHWSAIKLELVTPELKTVHVWNMSVGDHPPLTNRIGLGLEGCVP